MFQYMRLADHFIEVDWTEALRQGGLHAGSLTSATAASGVGWGMDLLLSDVHLRGLQDPNQDLLVRLLRAEDWGRVFVLGDLFHFWWGHDGQVSAQFVPVLAALHACAAAGCQVHFIPGNHDFAVGAGLEKLGIQVAQELRVHLAGHATLLAHGDQADLSLGYRGASRVLRSLPFAVLMRLLGPTRGAKLGSRLAADHEGGGSERILQAQKVWAETNFGPGCRLVVCGHSHTPGLHKLSNGALLNLGDVAHSQSCAIVDHAGIWPCVIREGRPVPTGPHLPARDRSL